MASKNRMFFDAILEWPLRVGTVWESIRIQSYMKIRKAMELLNVQSSECDLIESADTPLGAPFCLMKNKYGNPAFRVVVDYRRVNAKIGGSSYHFQEWIAYCNKLVTLASSRNSV